MEIQKTRLSDGRDAVLFWNADEPNGVFSNWHDEPFVVDDFCYRHVEQYMMAQKAKLFHDAAHYTAILKCDDPGECKKMGKQVTPFNSFLWDAHKYAIVYKEFYIYPITNVKFIIFSTLLNNPYNITRKTFYNQIFCLFCIYHYQ